MKSFAELQKEIWENTKRQAALAKLCIRGCAWLSDDGICVSSTGCMYLQPQGGNMESQYYVEIREFGTDKVEKRMGPMSERSAEKVEGGAIINLNHDKYYTSIVPVEQEKT